MATILPGGARGEVGMPPAVVPPCDPAPVGRREWGAAPSEEHRVE
ncbi:MAG: hypothetical protein ACK41W_01765 [Cyanobacteriota bacterium]